MPRRRRRSRLGEGERFGRESMGGPFFSGARGRGLSYVNRPTWQRIPGSIKVQYDYGFVGAQAGAPTNSLSPPMPATIACAVIETVGILASSQQYGGNPLQSESLAGYSYSLNFHLKFNNVGLD